MDSKVVAKQIRQQVWPLLRREGFTAFSAKTAWRQTPDQIHVVNYQSFNSYLADGIGCTTFSFALNLAIVFRAIPPDSPVKRGMEPSERPKVYQCHFTHELSKTIQQPILPRPGIWYVEPDGSNLLECVIDSRAALAREGLPWFDRFMSLEYVLQMLMEEDLPEVMATRSSPVRKRMIGYMARRIGRSDIAEPLISEAESEMNSIRERVWGLGKAQKARHG